MTDEHIIQQAEQEARQRKVSRMIPAKGVLTADHEAEVADSVRRYLAANELNNGDLARALGTSPAYISNLLSDTRRDDLPDETRHRLLRQANDWIEEHHRQADMRRPANFVEHKAAKRLITAAKHTAAMRCIGKAWGPTGIGKSETIRFLCSDDSPIPGTFTVEIDDDCRSAGGLRNAIWTACRSRRGQRAKASMALLYEKLANSGRLLIIDQAHLLRDNAFQTIMSLHDKAGIPILLVGTRDIDVRTEEDNDPEFGQLSGRIGYALDLFPWLVNGAGGGGRKALDWVSIDELRKMFQNKLKLRSDALEMLRGEAQIARGRLRSVKYLVFLAEAIARSDRPSRDYVTAADIGRAKELAKRGTLMRQEQQQPEVAEAVSA